MEVAATAQEDLQRLIITHSLPAHTRERVRTALAPLEEVPRLGPELTGRWSGLRLLLGPWRWMILVYEYHEEQDRGVVLTIQDARSSGAAPSAG